MGTETAIDIARGVVRVCAYQLTTGSGVSEIVAINNHQFLVEERDGKDLGDGTLAGVKQLFKIDLTGATEVTCLTGTPADQLALSSSAAPKTLVLDIVNLLIANGITADQIPAKIEGLALGNDIVIGGTTHHTLFIATDNDFVPGMAGGNKFYAFASSAPTLAQRSCSNRFPSCKSWA
jgi:Esterase-like activity of phytase